MDDPTLTWITNALPSLGVSVFFIVAWYLEKRDHTKTRDEYRKDLRRCVGFKHDDEPNGEE